MKDNDYTQPVIDVVPFDAFDMVCTSGEGEVEPGHETERDT